VNNIIIDVSEIVEHQTKPEIKCCTHGNKFYCKACFEAMDDNGKELMNNVDAI